MKKKSFNWKQFLKPNWKKFVIFIVLFFIGFYFGFLFLIGFCPPTLKKHTGCLEGTTYVLIQYRCGICIEAVDFRDIINGIILYFLIYPLLVFVGLFGNLLSERLMAALFWPCWIITSLIYRYLLSCLIVWIYDKFRKRK